MLNGTEQSIETNPEERLIDLLRNKYHLMGTKEACGEGKCGSCSLLIDGSLELACLIPAIRIDGKSIVTIEGLGDGSIPNYVQRAFVDADAIQCGFCTPGLIMAVFDYIEKGGSPKKERVKKALSGNLCRCTGYTKVIEAVELAIKYRNENNQN
ncbi:MAG: hypothetical protein UW64_C0004G0004 [Microgenomates group bacterium GW2011_GWC1_44_37]|uniref:2Fe-2S ferredoxin-type domain-containing protein n=1 Tax=Candidatus Collierbacteria bacterium GW2011_GWB2_44_22 TaxID=1618387 RepID=A0A0G1HZ68_9BACT|nr:MAG: hypothetical protein UW31_C0007G0008 [Candidatus Collierbacteria bacterium GW2011_GWA2_44_13]KKT50008.1 MAG: hypothetical protein UW42_C0026G0003 [Candidatus Collierbacteria bacterium GW2011_GWB1_44_197]KKT52240.1 MAG: hypothetical protein UW44_C0003G0083 [Candidatus Collierbacteria bacterium GW2011_GWB2_44_22]KKT62396.1 MAG: hypothetical protein UW56_C0007G0004 [Candidatus Collierbacteria bacterium GW2011_GWD1_44_27]KKT66818.1 MAG: hypothetical protein UW58_C0002G0003 [Candidatus Colli